MPYTTGRMRWVPGNIQCLLMHRLKLLTGTGIYPACPKSLMILKSFPGGETIVNLVLVWQAICLFTFFQVLMLSQTPKALMQYLLAGNCVIGKMAVMCLML